jgi:hypothetical protein
MVSRPVIRAVLASPSVDHLTSFFFFSYQSSRAAITTIVLFLGGKDKKMEKRGSVEETQSEVSYVKSAFPGRMRPELSTSGACLYYDSLATAPRSLFRAPHAGFQQAMTNQSLL